MNSEKVKEIKKDINFCTTKIGCEECSFMPIMASTNCRNELLKNCLILINELESENKELKKYKLDWLNSEKMHLQADMEDTEFELASSNRILEKVSKENQTLKDRIIELEKEIKENLSYAKGYADGIKNTYEAILSQKLENFAERLKEKMGVREYMGVKYKQGVFSENDIDETLKEFLLCN